MKDKIMPFNENGVWVNLDPYQEYKRKVIKSKEQPGSGGLIWTSELRQELHDAATRYIMVLEGIVDTAENFFITRERITRELEEEYDDSERNGLLNFQISPEKPSSMFYRRVGD